VSSERRERRAETGICEDYERSRWRVCGDLHLVLE
jgi:hypothetical protein